MRAAVWRAMRRWLRRAVCVVAFMVGASYAAVPLYNWFCRATGFNGTTHGGEFGAVDGPLRARSPCASTPMCRPRPALEVRAGAERDRGQDRRGRDRVLHRDQPGRAHHLRRRLPTMWRR